MRGQTREVGKTYDDRMEWLKEQARAFLAKFTNAAESVDINNIGILGVTPIDCRLIAKGLSQDARALAERFESENRAPTSQEAKALIWDFMRYSEKDIPRTLVYFALFDEFGDLTTAEIAAMHHLISEYGLNATRNPAMFSEKEKPLSAAYVVSQLRCGKITNSHAMKREVKTLLSWHRYSRAKKALLKARAITNKR